MFGFGNPYTNVPQKRVSGTAPSSQRLIGYILYPRNFSPSREGALRLEDLAQNSGYKLISHEQECGCSTNPFRPGLWRSLRRVICNRCEPKRMPLSMINFDDFVYQALAPCNCGNSAGYDGLIVTKLEHLIADHAKSSALIVRMAKLEKHLIAEDGICLSCCHPATRELVNKAAKETVNRTG